MATTRDSQAPLTPRSSFSPMGIITPTPVCWPGHFSDLRIGRSKFSLFRCLLVFRGAPLFDLGLTVKGDITIGPSGIIEEGAIIVNRFVTGPLRALRLALTHSRRREVMRIGDDNLFEIGCRSSTVSSLVPCDRL